MRKFSLQTERLLMSIPEISDAEEMLRYHDCNKEYHAASSPIRDSNFYSHDTMTARAKASIDEFQKGIGVYLYFRLKIKPEIILGHAHISQISRGPFQAGYLGYGLDKDHVGQGFMTEALKSIIEYVFSSLNLHRLMANYVPSNERSAQILEKLGFQKEGLAKDYLFLNGKWQDHVLTSLVNPNFTWSNL